MLPTYLTSPNVETIHRRLHAGEYYGAYADALLHLRDDPGQAAASILADIAILSERCDEALVVIQAQRSRLHPLVYHQFLGILSLFAGDLQQARIHGEALMALANGIDVGLALLTAIADRQLDHVAKLHLLRQREQRSQQVPLSLLTERWDVQALLGQHAQIIAEADQLLRRLPAANIDIQTTVKLHQVMAMHDQLRFTDSVAAAVRLARHIPLHMRPQPPTARIRTRRRQIQILTEIERLVLTENLPVILHAGTLLGLIRDGDLLPGDLDLDLATVPPATSADVVAALMATGRFKEQRHRVDTGTFRAVVHQPTGLTVDITEYQRDGNRFVSRWCHPSGQVLRESMVPAFTPVLMDVPGIGRRLPVPDDPAALLAATYGDWRTPDGGFDTMVAAPNLTGYTDFLASVTAIRLVDYLLAGRIAAARRLGQLLADANIDKELVSLLAAGNSDAPV